MFSLLYSAVNHLIKKLELRLMVISALLITKFGPNHISLPKILPLCWKFYQPLPDGMYLLKVNNRNRRRRSKISSKFTKKHQNDVFIINFEHISHLVLVFLLLTLSRQMLNGCQIDNKLMIELILAIACNSKSKYIHTKLQITCF